MTRSRKSLGRILRIVDVVLISMILSSCVSKGKAKWPAIERLDLENYPEAVFLSTDIGSPSFKAKHFYVIADSILISVNHPSEGQKVVTLSDLYSNKVYGEYLAYGNGPGEALICTEHLYRDTLYINDVAKKKLYTFVPTTIIRNSLPLESIPVFDYQGYGLTPFVTKLDSNSVLCENPYYFSDGQSRIFNNAKNRFDRYSVTDGPRMEHFKYDTYNVSQGILVPINDKVFYASSSKPLIEVYNKDGSRLKLMVGPSQLPARYSISQGSVTFKEKVPYAYLSYCITDNYLYFNYIGGYYEEGYNNLHSTILKFDFNGNLIASFILPEYISSFSVIDDNLIYGKGYNDQGETILKKLFRE